MTAALLFDLDDTLVVEEPAAVAAFEATARGRPTGTTIAVTPSGRGRPVRLIHTGRSPAAWTPSMSLASVFRHALSLLGARADAAVMVGDNLESELSASL